MTRPLRIGVSACFFHADSKRAIFKGKTLLYMEQSMAHWLMSQGAMPVLVPTAAGSITTRDLVDDLDGLLLQGGSDMSPTHYGETAVRPEWEGDYVRDLYEMELIRTCVELNRPVFGVCRGAQVINVAFGGSLYQDIQTMHPKRETHRNWEVYDQLFHDIAITPESWLSRALGGAESGRVNSVHHQGLKTLGRGLVAEARSRADDIVEAVRLQGKAFVYGVQWHPEFHEANDENLVSSRRLMNAFLEEVRERRNT